MFENAPKLPDHEQLMLESRENQRLIEGLTRPGERFVTNQIFYPAVTTREQLEDQVRHDPFYFSLTHLRFEYDNVVLHGMVVTGKEAAAVTGSGEDTEWVAVYGRQKSDLRLKIEFALDRYLRPIAHR